MLTSLMGYYLGKPTAGKVAKRAKPKEPFAPLPPPIANDEAGVIELVRLVAAAHATAGSGRHPWRHRLQLTPQLDQPLSHM